MSKDDKNNEDLNELLDSALEDFDRVDTASQTSQSTTKNDTAAASSSTSTNESAEAFFEEHATMLAERMKTLFGGPETPSGDMPPLPQDPEKLLAGFKKVAEAACMTLEGTNPASDEEVNKYSDSIAQALRGLQEGADNLNQPLADSDPFSLLGNLNFENAAEGDGNILLPFMEGMMQSLLSAELLLPSIKELLEKYTKYFEENGDKIPAEDKERYEKQLELYKTVEAHLESESPDDSPSVKREKFRVVLDDMRKLRDLGKLPDDILSDQPDLPDLDSIMGGAGGNSGPQCPTM